MSAEAPARGPALPRPIVWLGLVSLATDASSEMIYPLLPVFLTTVLGASAAAVGGIEGVAEATASLLKLASGRLADRSRRRKPLTLFGYTVSTVARPLVGLATAPWMVLAVRVIDRVGKGLRSSPRDALLGALAPAGARGRAFGFHRAMDNAGAVLGPLVASVLLTTGALSLRAVFLLSAIPGALSLAALALGVEEPASPPEGGAPAPRGAAAHAVSFREVLGVPGLRPYLGALALFALGNASDAFLLLRASALGMSPGLLPALWMAHNVLKAGLGTFGGALSDRLGRRRVILLGWAIYGLSYIGFGLATTPLHVWVLMVVYAVYYALVEGSERALLVDLVRPEAHGRAFGLYHSVVGLAALPASVGFGLLAERHAALPFFVAAGLALGAAAVLWLRVPERAVG